MNKKISLTLAIFLLLITFLIGMLPQREIQNNCNDDSCYLQLAKENNNSDFCINSTNNSKCYYFLALYLKNSTLCKLEKEPTKCLQSYAISTGNQTICQTLNSSSKFECILSYAINRGEINVCNLIENSSYCYYSYALYYKDPLLCDLTKEYKKDCITYLEKK